MGQPPDFGAPPGTPRWVKVFAIIGIIVVVLLIIILLLGENHGPGRHLGTSETAGSLTYAAQRMDQR